MSLSSTVQDYLRTRQHAFDLVSHPHSASSLQSARVTHVPARSLVKAVVLEDDESYVMAVLPGSRKVKLGDLRMRTGRMMRLATEEELCGVFADCERGAVPPLGRAYGMETIWDDSLMGESDLYFEAGDHETLVHMKTSDFIALMGDAQHMSFSAPIGVAEEA